MQRFQQPCEPPVAPERVKKRLHRQQVHEACFMLDRLLQALKRQIEILHSDGSQRFR
jgi:hypothetical protein